MYVEQGRNLKLMNEQPQCSRINTYCQIRKWLLSVNYNRDFLPLLRAASNAIPILDKIRWASRRQASADVKKCVPEGELNRTRRPPRLEWFERAPLAVTVSHVSFINSRPRSEGTNTEKYPHRVIPGSKNACPLLPARHRRGVRGLVVLNWPSFK